MVPGQGVAWGCAARARVCGVRTAVPRRVLCSWSNTSGITAKLSWFVQQQPATMYTSSNYYLGAGECRRASRGPLNAQPYSFSISRFGGGGVLLFPLLISRKRRKRIQRFMSIVNAHIKFAPYYKFVTLSILITIIINQRIGLLFFATIFLEFNCCSPNDIDLMEKYFIYFLFIYAFIFT